MLAGFNLVACNDDDKRAPSPEPEITNIHAYGLPVSVGNTAFKTDGQGRLTGIRQVNNPGNLETELEYGSFTVPGQEGEFQVKIQGGRSFWLPMYVRLNPQGFAGYAYMPKSPVVGGAADPVRQKQPPWKC